MNVLIITGGDVEIASAAGFLKSYESPYVVAVDGGLDAMEKLGLSPDCIVGDFDTIEADRLRPYREQGIRFETHRPEKDYTDTELAVLYALELPDVTRIVVLGALGKRFDHALGNVHSLFHALKRQIPCELIDRYNRIFLTDRETVFEKKEAFGKYISFVPFDGTVEGLTLTGFKYPLNHVTVPAGNTRCISNELLEDRAVMCLEKGIMICIESRD